MDTILAEASFRCENIHEQWFEMMFKVTEFTSVNSLHGLNSKTGAVYDQPWTIKFKNEMADQLIAADPKKNCPWITYESNYYIACTYIIKHHMWSRDCDNMHKITQDCICNAIGINDSRIIEIHNYKAYRPGDYEYLIARFGISHYNYQQFM
jgi:Holliday junction resolvase RusA-like endonuclease